MDNAGYVTLARQSGLMAEMRAVANNIANISTTGFRREGAVFAEHVDALGAGAPSLSIAHAAGRVFDPSQGALRPTGGTLDLAIEGDGYFLIEGADGRLLTRAGAFALSPEGDIVDASGQRLLDAAGAPVSLPPGISAVSIGRDGVISAGGLNLGQIGLVRPSDGTALQHHSGTSFVAPTGLELAEGRLFQGFLENSNVNPVAELTRMIEVQRAYEAGQSLLERDDARIRAVVETLGR